MNEWDRLLDQAFLTLNLLRTSRNNPNLSAYAYLFGNFNFSATPMAPPGTRVLVHKKPGTRASWDTRAKEGWYIGRSPEHYRCVKCYLPATRQEVDADTMVFIPHKIDFPEVKLEDFLKQAAMDILTLLYKPPPSTVPSLQAGDPIRKAILQLATILQRTNQAPEALQHRQHLLLNDMNHHNTRLQAKAPHPDFTTSSATNKSSPFQHPPPYHLHTNTPANNTLMHQLARVLHQRAQQHNHQHLTNFQKNAYRHPTINHIYDSLGRKQTLSRLLQGEDKILWQRSASNEFGRLAQGNDYGISGTNTIEFITPTDLPPQAKTTYASFVCDIRLLKKETHRVRMVVEGDRLTYHEDTGSPAASLVETKLLLNSTISDAHKGAKFFTCDLKDFYLATPMEKPEFMQISAKHIPQDIYDKYHIADKITKDNNVFIRINKGMYGLRQAAVLAYNKLVKHLSKHDYHPIQHTVGLWTHKSRPIKFCLCVDDFEIKYFNPEDAHHLINALNEEYVTSVDFTGSHFCGLKIDWNYPHNHVDISMPNYIQQLLKKLNYTPNTPQYSPFPTAPFTIARQGQRQYAHQPDDSPLLSIQDTTKVQSIVGSLLYYARAVDCAMLTALNTIAATQSAPTETTLKHCFRLLDYAATYPSTKVRFYASPIWSST